MKITPDTNVPEKYREQVGLIKKGRIKLNITKPATINDGIISLEESNHKDLLRLFENAAIAGRFMKFIPASGAATRMSSNLFSVFKKDCSLADLELMAKEGDQKAKFASTFMNGIRKFAFFPQLELAIKKSGLSVDQLLSSGNFHDLFDFVLTEKGLNLSELPKALLRFHRYENEVRTAFEEHLVESIKSISCIEKKVILHLTISQKFQKQFEELLKELRAKYSQYQLEVEFSSQDENTNTIALSCDLQMIFDENGNLLTRPGGHGTLLKNLDNLKGDLVLIKNIDNIPFDRNDEESIKPRKLLSGYLVHLQKQIFFLINKLIDESSPEETLGLAEQFIKNYLCFSIRESYKNYSNKLKKDYLLKILNRPLRVCGMVKNAGEPGGGPFWVFDKEGNESLQIVEQSQFTDDQMDILKESTHFNPVDMVCALKNYSGRNFNLFNYRDELAYFIGNKTYNGEVITTFEYPGLWNGGMANWNTVFVEVPASTFTPVKEVNDLLKPVHQPD
ncbi:MAG: DUF4301 family protein [Bacteroidetes bacterium]|nr:DUF4301 family protein [Bacteroidota bacterium]